MFPISPANLPPSRGPRAANAANAAAQCRRIARHVALGAVAALLLAATGCTSTRDSAAATAPGARESLYPRLADNAATSTALSQLAAGAVIRHPADGALMVWVPAGPFTMGIDRATAEAQAAQLGYADYHAIAAEEGFPAHTVETPGYFIDVYEVTIQRWAAFVAATGWTHEPGIAAPTWTGPDITDAERDLPIARVSWAAAKAYAAWAGKQLPTEAMWEKAARGFDDRWYPWGNDLPDGTKHGRLSMDGQLPGPVAVGSFPDGASPYGCQDMAGNVYEWTADWKVSYPGNPEPEATKPGEFVALRGGSFYHTRHSYRVAKRFGFRPTETYFHVGLRTVWLPPADLDPMPLLVAD